MNTTLCTVKHRALFSHALVPLFIAMTGGALMPFAFAPYHLFPLAMVGLTLLHISVQQASPKQAFHRGLAFGLGFYGVGIWWVYIAVRYFGNAAPALAVLLTALLIGYMALFPALLCAVQRRWFAQTTHWTQYVIFPSLWVLFEWLRGWLFTGFPWLFVGYSQLAGPLKGFAPIGGVYLLSFLTALCASLLSGAIFKRTSRWVSTLGTILLISLIGFGLTWVNWTTPTGKTLSVSLLQGNIGKELKWNPKSAFENIDIYSKMTEANWSSQLVVWPESTFNLTQLYGKPLLDKLDAEAKKHQTTVNIGLPYLDENNQFYNALMLIGHNQGTYFKRHLVPFGEYTPLSGLIKPMMSWLKIPMSDFRAGSPNQPLLTVFDVTIAPYICYEIVYPSLVRQDLPQAQLLMTISEDAWYGDSNAVDQHLEMVQMRSLESGRWSLFAVNTGISAIIDEKGDILKQIGMHQRGTLRANVPAMTGRTPWVLLGDGFWLLLMGMALVLVLATRKNKKGGKSGQMTNS